MYQNTKRILQYRNLYSNTQKHSITYVLIDWKHKILVDSYTKIFNWCHFQGVDMYITFHFSSIWRPIYSTEADLLIATSSTTILFRPSGICLFFVRNILKKDFEQFKVSLLHKNQFCNFLEDVFDCLIIRLCIFLLCIKTPVSSAYSLMLMAFADLTMSFIYRIKNNGPKTEPWGTPQLTVLIIDVYPLYTCTVVGWSDRIEESHWRVL